MEDPIMKEIPEDTSEIREAEKQYQGCIADAELRDRLEARDTFRRPHLQLLHDAKEKGRDEERRETAGRMRGAGLNAADIARYTGLPEEEIREL